MSLSDTTYFSETHLEVILVCKNLRFIFKKRSEKRDCMKFKISPIKIKTIRVNFVNVTDNEKVH